MRGAGRGRARRSRLGSRRAVGPSPLGHVTSGTSSSGVEPHEAARWRDESFRRLDCRQHDLKSSTAVLVDARGGAERARQRGVVVRGVVDGSHRVTVASFGHGEAAVDDVEAEATLASLVAAVLRTAGTLWWWAIWASHSGFVCRNPAPAQPRPVTSRVPGWRRAGRPGVRRSEGAGRPWCGLLDTPATPPWGRVADGIPRSANCLRIRRTADESE
jgi:hypothetical protein